MADRTALGQERARVAQLEAMLPELEAENERILAQAEHTMELFVQSDAKAKQCQETLEAQAKAHAAAIEVYQEAIEAQERAHAEAASQPNDPTHPSPSP